MTIGSAISIRKFYHSAKSKSTTLLRETGLRDHGTGEKQKLGKQKAETKKQTLKRGKAETLKGGPQTTDY